MPPIVAYKNMPPIAAALDNAGTMVYIAFNHCKEKGENTEWVKMKR
jgi:hypothetical protein